MELTTTQLTEQQSKAWLGMAQTKNVVASTLAKEELAAQTILMLPNAPDHQTIDAALAAYRKKVLDVIDYRKQFTNKITTGIIEPLMAFEKRLDPKINEQYKTLEIASLDLRKKEFEKVAAINLINQELADFKMHLQTEFWKYVNAYKTEARKQINSFYAMALKAKTKVGVEQALVFLKDIQIAPIVKFRNLHLEKSEMLEIYNAFPKPNMEHAFTDMCDEFTELFEHFDAAVLNADAALKAQEEKAMQMANEENQKLKESIAINTLVGMAETATIAGPKIKKTLVVEVSENEGWAKAVLGAYLMGFNDCAKFRRGSFSKMSIGQMADQLGKLATENGVCFANLNLVEIVK